MRRKKRLTGLDMRIEVVDGERGTRHANEGRSELGVGGHQSRWSVVSSRESRVVSRFYGSASILTLINTTLITVAAEPPVSPQAP